MLTLELAGPVVMGLTLRWVAATTLTVVAPELGGFLHYARKEAAIWLSLAAFQNLNELRCILTKQLQTRNDAHAVDDTISLIA